MKTVWNLSKWIENRDMDDTRIVRDTIEYGVIENFASEQEADDKLISLAQRAKKKGWPCSTNIGQHSIAVHYMNKKHVVMYFSAEKAITFGKIPFHPQH